MIKYDTYKDSGIEWLGDIPEHWRLVRIKEILKTQSGTTPRSNNPAYYDGEHNWIRTTDLNNSWLFESEYKITPRALEDCNLKFIPVDSVLLAMYGGFGTIGKNSLLKKESTINQSVCAILPNRKTYNPEYLYYFCKYFRRDWKLFADGARKDPNINQEAIKELFVYYPPLPEQQAIAQYLDTKTQAIDKKVSLLEKKIDYYTELRKSIINDAVTKGLDKNVELKDSDIDWIGQIPKHWEVKRFKSFGKTIKGKNLETFDKPFENSLPNLSLDYLRNETATFPVFCYSSNKSLQATDEDIVIVWDGAAVGEILEAKEGYISSTIAKFEFKKTYLKRYFYYLGGHIHYILSSIPTGMGIPHLNPNILNNLMCPFPPKAEQTEIAQYLDNKTSTIDAIITNIGKQIDHLKELRKTLVNDVVTGKIKVI